MRHSRLWAPSLLMAAVACVASAALADPALAPRFEGAAAFGDWQRDGPGAIHGITPADLPAPFATKPAAHVPQIVPRPAGLLPKVPPGFKVELFAEGLSHPRLMRTAPGGDVFVSETRAGRISSLRAGEAAAFATGLDHPFGLAFYPPGAEPKWLYVANETSVVRFPYRNGEVTASAPPEVIVPHLPGGGHTTRDVALTPDGRTMLVSVGSGSNIAEDMEAKTLDMAAAWDKSAGAVGAGWDGETDRATVLAFDPDGKGRRLYATGLRNCVSVAIEPSTGGPWCAVNERDLLGDDLVPDYVTRVDPGAWYGWPWYYLGNHEDPRHAGRRPDLTGKARVPDVLIQPHSAPIQMTFYDGTLFPPGYRGSAFVALHGSWNRSKPTGYKVVRILMRDGKPTGEYEDFMTGFLLDDDRAWGRPTGVTIAADGALLVSDDANGLIWRVTATLAP